MPFSIKTCVITLFFLFIGFCAVGFPADGGKEALISAIENKYETKSFSAEFEQSTRLSALDMTENASGKAWFSHPGKMRWQYITPERHEIITNGKTIWILRPDEDQVMVGRAQNFFKPGTGGAFLSDIRKIRSGFSIEEGKVTDEFAQLILTPKHPTQDLARAVLTVALPSHEIRMVVTENSYGDTTRFVFSHIRFGTAEPSMFEASIPEGTSVIQMD